ncbi:putative acyl-CoA desaturase [Hyaloscypha hepaticicola]|uniref:Acyl-CoA desaturase n=1 Tax=Hyaloscypha hepaticicola TaxID=2082293 RepID=A0A2J6QGT4_9HELO|nr:putative acyl-CoA desaturase [Hyaloscypha hepaticicola]
MASIMKAGAVKEKKDKHISEQPVTLKNWYKHIDWVNVTFVAIIPFFGLIAAFSTPLLWKTAAWTLFYYFLTGLGITAGYHRLWSHTSYTATLPIQIALALLGGGAIQGSIRWWSRNHRAHHRYTDTLKDPYSVQKGILYSHMGWMVLKQDKKSIGRVDITDLNNDPLVMFQHKHFVFVALSMAFLFPCVVAGLGWGDWKGGLIYAGILRLFVVQQATFCVNSLAHWLGDQPFDDRNTPRDHVLTALVTLGEGYHNFHHEFPADYRNAIEWHQYDPTKWMIWAWKQVGLASNLKTCRRSIIEKGRVQQMQKQLDKKRATLEWGIPIEDLPLVEWDDFVQRARDGEALVAIGGVIHNVGSFMKDHPGGKALIASAVGKDATSMFNGGVYDHTNAAHNLLSTMRVGVLRGGVEVECWKRRPVKGEVISSTLSCVG